MAEVKITFNLVIKRIFDSWMALKVAVEHSFGGTASQDIAKWMVDATEHWFKENKNVEAFEVEEVLESILNNELDTVADDGSLAQVSTHLCTCYKLLQDGKFAEVEHVLSLLPNVHVNQCIHRPDDSSSESENDMDVASTSQGASNCTNQGCVEDTFSKDTEMEEDDGWTKVGRKPKKR